MRVLPFPTRQYRLEIGMDAATANAGADFHSSRLRPRHALAGLQAGVLGAFLLLACLMISSLWNGRSVWLTPNLFATTFFGGAVYRNHFVRASWIGLALILAFYGGLGAAWGCIWREQRRRFSVLFGALAGIGLYFLLYDFAWRHINPLVATFAPNRALETGHVLWGMMLARSSVYARRIAHSTSHAAPDVTQHAPEVAEIRSGEVIR